MTTRIQSIPILEARGGPYSDAPEAQRKNAMASPSGRMGRAEDIADVVAFLASEACRWVTGQTIASTAGRCERSSVAVASEASRLDWLREQREALAQ